MPEEGAAYRAETPAAAVRALRQWEQKALHRLQNGRRAECPFATEALPAGVVARIGRELARCETAAEVAAVFRNGGGFREADHPRDQRGRFSSKGGETQSGHNEAASLRFGGDVLPPYTPTEQDTQRLHEETRKIHDAVQKITGLPSQWSGQFEWLPEGDDVAYARKRRSCAIALHPHLENHPLRWVSLHHEVLHAHSNGLYAGANTYDDFRGWEEGPNEALAELLRKETFQHAGVEVPETVLADHDAQNPFHDYFVAPLEQLREALGEDARAFYTDLLKQPLARRGPYLLEMRTKLPQEKWKEYKETWGKANAKLKAKVPLHVQGTDREV